METDDEFPFDGRDPYAADSANRPSSHADWVWLACPQCASRRVEARHLARRFMGALGTLAGASGAASRAWAGGELGAGLGAVAGAPGALIGAVAGATLNALAGGTTGCTLGLRLGEAIDSALLKSHGCLDCKHRFNTRGQQGGDWA